MYFKSNSLLIFLFLFISACFTSKKQVSHFQNKEIKIDSTYSNQKAMDSFLLPYRSSMDSIMDVVIGYSDVPLSKAQPESTMGNFMADAQLFVGKKYNKNTVVSVINYGGMRIPYLSPGAITKGNIYEMMPFDNKLVLLQVPGSVLKQFCQHIAAYKGWPVSGLSFQIKDGKAINILVDGKEINEQVIYICAVSDYIANGGDNCDFLIKLKREQKNIFVRDMLIEYVEEMNAMDKKISPKIENRITYAE